MTIQQIYTFVNETTQEVLGETGLKVAEDLTNIVDIGDSIANAVGYDAYVKALVNRIGRMVFVNRPYDGRYPKLMVDAWTFGSILGKVQANLIDATENESWDLIQGASYDPYVINLPVVDVKFYNKQVVFEIDITLPRYQVEQSFTSADEMGRFIAMVETMVRNSLNVKIDSLLASTVNNFMGATIDANNGAQVIHLLTEYNALAGTSLSAKQAMISTEFLRYASAVILEKISQFKAYSVLHNLGGKPRHTPQSMQHLILHSTFANRLKTHLQATTFHDELNKLSGYDETPFWQGSGTSFDFNDTSKIDVTATLADGTSKAVSKANIVATLFDREALGVLQPKERIEGIYNPKGSYYNEFYKYSSRYFNDMNENLVVFILD